MKIEFEKQFGKGTDPWYAKAERWAKKQKFPISFLALGFIEWLKNKWIDVKVANTMKEIDIQAEEIKKIWEQYDEEEAKQFAPEIIETPSEVEGLNDLMIGPRDDIDFYGY
tara:strand:+ start:776 stop:1108 length:333 start_codon:yes stop_codon:yes gene_type:complete